MKNAAPLLFCIQNTSLMDAGAADAAAWLIEMR